MIKIFINDREVIELNAMMDLRLGQKVTVLGTEYLIDRIKNERDCVKVFCEEKMNFAVKYPNASSGIIMTNKADGVSFIKNPFDR